MVQCVDMMLKNVSEQGGVPDSEWDSIRCHFLSAISLDDILHDLHNQADQSIHEGNADANSMYTSTHKIFYQHFHDRQHGRLFCPAWSRTTRCGNPSCLNLQKKPRKSSSDPCILDCRQTIILGPRSPDLVLRARCVKRCIQIVLCLCVCVCVCCRICPRVRLYVARVRVCVARAC